MPAEVVDLVVTSPGWRPDQPMLLEAAARGIPVWGEVELAWRLRAQNGAAPWLTVTGTNCTTTTVKKERQRAVTGKAVAVRFNHVSRGIVKKKQQDTQYIP